MIAADIVRLAGPEPGVAVLRPAGAVRRRLSGAHALTVEVRLTATDAAGRRQALTRRVRLALAARAARVRCVTSGVGVPVAATVEGQPDWPLQFLSRPPEPPPMPPAASPNKWLVLVIVCFAQFMVVLDATIVNVALPSIQTGLELLRDLQWIVNAYTLVFGGFLLLGGRAGDLVGRRLLFMAGSSVLVGLAGCALASRPRC